MSATTEFTIWCDHEDCMEWATDTDARNVTEARKRIARQGWRCSRSRDLCPDHTPDENGGE